MVVFGGDLWPLGDAVAFVDLPLEEAVGAYRDWGSGWESPPKLVDLGSRPIMELLRELLPLQMPYKRRLLVGTDSGWTAVFDNSRGGDPFPSTYLARQRARRAVVATHKPRSQTTHPATQFHLFGPNGKPPLMYERTIDAGVFDEERWRFDASGTVQPFEDTAAYTQRLIRDRFTREMLLRYLMAMGIRADDPTF